MVPPREDTVASTAGGTRRPLVTWLRRSEYIQSDSRTSTTKAETIESNFAYSARTAPQRTYETREEQIEGIERSFEPPAQYQHPRKKHLKVKATYPIFPDTTVEDNVYTIAQFTANPGADDRQTKQSNDDNTERGIFRPISNPHDPTDSYLIWFLPDQDSTQRLKRKAEHPDKPYGDKVCFVCGVLMNLIQYNTKPFPISLSNSMPFETTLIKMIMHLKHSTYSLC
jgi:RNA polymerase II-associated factor 1